MRVYLETVQKFTLLLQVFLASDLSKYCTGITLDVNGGMLIH